MAPEQTNVCPGCGYEYESWVEVCPDCNLPVQLRSAKPRNKEEPAGDPRWTVVANVPNAIIGNLIKSQLQDADIPVLMMRSPSADIAEFSHNDYVPQDIRVPQHLAAEARRLIDAPPDVQGAQLDAESDPDPDLYEQGADYGLPTEGPSTQGWSVLPTHGPSGGSSRAPAGWYWSDEGREREFSRQAAALEEEYPASYSGYDLSPSHDDPYSQPNWIRVFYGILLTVISLPFIFQLLQQIASIFGPSHR
ncbi:MAG TPA: hypothetical protein VM409_02765 [Chloroflexia bacterium]|nr:hypothetical protein [Chloroflexia bacterium]